MQLHEIGLTFPFPWGTGGFIVLVLFKKATCLQKGKNVIGMTF